MPTNLFHTIYSEHYENIYRFIYRVMGDSETAKDFCQDTFTKLFTQLNSGQRLENPKAWLFKVASNQCNSALSRGVKFKSIQREIETTQTQLAESPEDAVMRLDQVLRLRQVLATLKPEEQTLVQLYSEGFSYKEMADITEIKLSSIGQTLWRAIGKCSSRLKDRS